jgi:hypothetical protein
LFSGVWGWNWMKKFIHQVLNCRFSSSSLFCQLINMLTGNLIKKDSAVCVYIYIYIYIWSGVEYQVVHFLWPWYFDLSVMRALPGAYSPSSIALGATRASKPPLHGKKLSSRKQEPFSLVNWVVMQGRKSFQDSS